jgi:hypothetical protein
MAELEKNVVMHSGLFSIRFISQWFHVQPRGKMIEKHTKNVQKMEKTQMGEGVYSS